jgi:hypothetical protein
MRQVLPLGAVVRDSCFDGLEAVAVEADPRGLRRLVGAVGGSKADPLAFARGEANSLVVGRLISSHSHLHLSKCESCASHASID